MRLAAAASALLLLQYDFVELLDGSRLIAKEHRGPSEVDTKARLDHPVTLHQAGFIQYLESGVWHFAFYNDGRSVEMVSFNTIIQGTNTRVSMSVPQKPAGFQTLNRAGGSVWVSVQKSGLLCSELHCKSVEALISPS